MPPNSLNHELLAKGGNEGTLGWLYVSGGNGIAYEGAINHVYDQSVLAFVLCADGMASFNSYSPLVWSQLSEYRQGTEGAVWARLTDQELIRRIATHARRGQRYAAVNKLMDQPLLGRIAIEDEYEPVRKEAAERITDTATLAKAAAAAGYDDAAQWRREHPGIHDSRTVARANAMIDAFPDLIYCRTEDSGRTPLHVAAYDSLEMTRFFLARGADPSVQDYEGHTPLHFAGSAEIAELLLAKGASAKAQDIYGYTPLHQAGSKGVAQALINAGAEVNARNNWGATPLHTATSITEFLISKGADIDAQDNAGHTPLHEAAEHDYEDVTATLLKHGANPNARDKNGVTPLHEAVRTSLTRDSRRLVELLLAAKADPNIRDDSGQTALGAAISGGRGPEAEIIRQHGGHE